MGISYGSCTVQRVQPAYVLAGGVSVFKGAIPVFKGIPISPTAVTTGIKQNYMASCSGVLNTNCSKDLVSLTDKPYKLTFLADIPSKP